MNKFFEVMPGVVLVWVCVAAAIPAYRILLVSSRGRARSAIAYLSGLFTGIGTTMLLFMLIGVMAEDAPQIGGIGLLGALFGPLLGMARAKWLRATRRRSRHSLRSVGFDPS
jgi:hypothetical protein